MGSSNALAAYRLYAGRVTATSLNVLVYMALVALDRDDEPSWWEGHEMLAIRCLGRADPVTRTDLRAVERAITPLFDEGAITTIRHASGRHGRITTVRYRLWLISPAPDEKRRERKPGSRRKVAQLPTKSGTAPDEKRRTKEEEEEEERDLLGLASVDGTVEGARAGEVEASPNGSSPDLRTREGTERARAAASAALTELQRTHPEVNGHQAADATRGALP
jgi:hypothetical protein